MSSAALDLIAILNAFDHSFFSNLVSSIDHGIFGLLLVCNPDIILVHDVSLEADDNNNNDNNDLLEHVLTDFTRISFMGTGTTLLTVLLYHILYLKNERDERVLLRLKLVNYICQCLLLWEGRRRRLLLAAPPFSWFWTLRFITSAVMAVWLMVSLLMHSNYHAATSTSSSTSTNTVAANKTKKAFFKSVEMAVVLEFAYCLTIGYLAVMTLFVSSSSSSSSSLSSATTTTTQRWWWWKTDILVALCWQGTHFLALLAILFRNVEHVPTADAKLLQIQNGLFLLVLLVVAFVHQQDVDAHERWALQLFLVAHAVMTFLVYKLSNDNSNNSSNNNNDDKSTQQQQQLTNDITMNNVGDEPVLVNLVDDKVKQS